jgi:hypothetical protein
MGGADCCRQPTLAFRETFLPYYYDAELKVDMKPVEA